MTKYQLQASNKWGFDFIKETPITHASSQFKWESTTLSDMPKFYRHIAHPTRLMHPPAGSLDVANHTQLFSECENICPLSRAISAPSMMLQHTNAVNKRKIIVAASSSFAASTDCSSQRKITGESRQTSKKKMRLLTASLRLITPLSDLKTINFHQILIHSLTAA